MKALGLRPRAFIVFRNPDETDEARVFEIASQSKLKLRSRKRNKIVKIRLPNHRHGYDFLCYIACRAGVFLASERSDFLREMFGRHLGFLRQIALVPK